MFFKKSAGLLAGHHWRLEIKPHQEFQSGQPESMHNGHSWKA
jgi:hypothetical protein